MVDGVYVGGSLARGEGGQDAGAGAKINDSIAAFDVLPDRLLVKCHALAIREHAFLFMQVGKHPPVMIAIIRFSRVVLVKPRGNAGPILNPIGDVLQQRATGGK